MLQRLLIGLLLVGSVLCAPQISAEEPAESTKSALLTLQDGSQIHGQLNPSQTAGTIRWSIDEFVSPIDFPVDHFVSAVFPAPARREQMKGVFSVEFHSGDVIAGEITKWEQGQLTLESPRFGSLTLLENAIRRIDRIDDEAELLYSGLTGVSDFRTVEGPWIFDGMRLVTSEPGSRIIGEFELPDRVMVEFAVSREEGAEFSFVIAFDSRDKRTAPFGWSCTAFGNSLALIYEQEKFAALKPVGTLSQSDTVRLIAYLDQPGGAIHLYERTGKPLAVLQIPESIRLEHTDKLATGLGLILNDEGTVRLEQLSVSHWNGVLPAAQLSAIRQFHLNDGTTVAGPAESFEHSAETVTQTQNNQTLSFELTELKRAVFAGESNREPRQVVVLMSDQSRISGELVSVSDQTLTVRSPDVVEPIGVSLAGIRTLFNASGHASEKRESKDDSVATLYVSSGTLKGRLVDSTGADEESCLVWQPQLGSSSSALKPLLSGRIVYREPVAPKPEVTVEAVPVEQPNQNALQKFGQLFFENLGRGRARRERKNEDPQPHDIHLITGDVIPCEIESISAQGVHFSSKMTDTRLIGHEHLRAVVFDRTADVPELEKARRERLLTLPRNQKASPPTHLLCSSGGDFLRCRLNALDQDALVVEIQLSDHEIPADRVSHIIWMHPERSIGTVTGEREGESTSEENPEPTMVVAGQIQARMAKDNRSTFVPIRVENGEIVGTSSVFGECRVPISRIDQLLLGEAVVDAAGDLPYHDWKLQPAVEPLYTQGTGDGQGASAPGMASSLIDKPAPDFQLPLLDGGEFVLSENRDQIVLLDFWATWCGPCMLTMPLLEKAMKEFEGKSVRLISVNLEERPEQIREVRDRHKLSMTVALDRDGAISRRYSIQSIPQLIVIDREGVVHRHFIGGGQTTVDEAARAVRDLLKEPADSLP
ncbi:TlpA family protein disulfide reductase [Rubinisphaera margarita]|uniref:TlpA family protein disulfide reductase n=1 Tax=Rubinisphaera margarita TaxID=2909586 RepID=UPI001EE98A08|nr:TlpA disulfide reductase family protein [Rubinisphaera margarita]MCG6156408.1 TlpA family protein disulfide reductase [Rubinisphaera margarita]